MRRKRRPEERKLRTREHVLADLSINYLERRNRMTYEQFDALLTHLGLTRERVESKWLRYRHEDADLVIVVAAKPASEFVRVSDAVSARRHLVEKGVVSAKELDELLSQNSIPEATGKKA